MAVNLRLGNFDIAANLSRRELVDLLMAWQAGCLSIGWVPPNRVIATFAQKGISRVCGGAVRGRAVSRLDLQRLANAA